MQNNEWKSRLASIKRMRRQTVSREEFLRFEEINVTHGVDVFYENGVITFINSESNMEIREYVRFTHVQDSHSVSQKMQYCKFCLHSN